MKIFHILPKNLIPSGGIKVHYQLSELERELGYQSFVVYKDLHTLPRWFKHNVQHITEQEMHSIANKHKDLIVGWEDPEPVLRSGFFNKVSYVQGEVFINRSNPYHGITIWFSNDFNRNALPHLQENDSTIVTPFIDTRVFNCDDDVELKHYDKRPWKLAVQERKAGQEALSKIARAYNNDENLSSLLATAHVMGDCNESDFANTLSHAQIFLAHSFPEGLGLPGLEAMACGCLVVGFTGGGGNVYMSHGINCLISPRDGDYHTLGAMLAVTQGMSLKEKLDIVESGRRTAKVFSRQRTKVQLENALSMFEEE